MELPFRSDLTNQELADILNFISGVLALQAANRFRVRAYQNAAVIVEQLPQPWYELAKTPGKLAALPGIGDTIETKLVELLHTGTIAAFQSYVKDIPAGTFVLDQVPGLGVKKSYRLASEFQLEDPNTAVAKLMEAAQAGLVQKIDGFGVKSEADLIIALQTKIQKKRLPLAEVQPIADNLLAAFQQCPVISRAEALGSLRRKTQTVGDIDIGLAVTDIPAFHAFVRALPQVKQILVAGDQLMRVILTDHHQVDLKLSTPAEWGAFLQHFTGSKEHNIKLREYALRQGKSLSEHGIKLTDEDGHTKLKTFDDEAAFYAELGLDWIPPQDRVGADEISRAKH